MSQNKKAANSNSGNSVSAKPAETAKPVAPVATPAASKVESVKVAQPVNKAAVAHVRSFYARGYNFEFGRKTSKAYPVMFSDLPALLGYDLQGDQMTFAAKTFHYSCNRNRAVGGGAPKALWSDRTGKKVDDWGKDVFEAVVGLAEIACQLGAVKPTGIVDKAESKEPEKMTA